MPEHGDGFGRIRGSRIGTPQYQFQISPYRLAFFLQQSNSLFGAIVSEQCTSVEHVCVANQERLREVFVEYAQSCDGFRSASTLQIRGRQIISNIVADVAGVRFGPA